MSDDLILADAIYAAGQALHVDACTEGDPHDGCDCGDWDREAEIAVRAALPSIAHARDDVPTLLAEVRRLRAMEQRVRALHHRDVAVVITGGCAAEDCNHEELGDCDTIEFAYCAGCAALAEQVDCYFSERDFRPVAWPCPTIVALDGGE